MALKTSVIVGNITNLSDARYCAGMGVDLLCFPLDGEHGVSKDDTAAISNWVSGVEFGGEITGKILPDLRMFDITHIGIKNESILNEVCQTGKKVLLHVNSSRFSELMTRTTGLKIDHYILTHPDPPDSQLLNQLTGWAKVDSIYYAGLMSHSNLEDILKTGIKGLYLRGQNEDHPGANDYEELAKILEQLEVE